MIQNDDKKGRKVTPKFICEMCDFNCGDTYKWDRHILTRKHLNNDKIITKRVKKGTTTNILVEEYICVCGKGYKYRQGLHAHKQKCPNYLTILNGDNYKNKISPQIILELIKENKELKELLVGQNNTIIELSKEQNKTIIELSKKNNIVNSTVNSNNTVFNLQFFLNDTCKDAMNLTDFVNSIKQQLSDLEDIEQVGFVNGISKIFVKNLKILKQENCPLHCTDEKRKVIYVKDENKWEKDEEHHKKIRHAIKRIAKDTFMTINEFKKKYPCCTDPDSKYNTRYNNLRIEVLGGSGNNDIDNENKIIKNISKEIKIQNKKI
jgi:hypothetical protein